MSPHRPSYQFLQQHGGYSNAWTGGENTNFHFEVAADNLEGALDRFAQFFIAPLFDESTTERELNAVDSEHKKNLNDDSWRLNQLYRSYTSKTHPFHRFSTGNVQTLRDIPQEKGINVRKLLLEFHEKYYSANLMKLVVLGKEPVEQLAEWVTTMFSAVKNANIPVPKFEGHPLTADHLQKVIKVKPVGNLIGMDLEFPLPDLRPYYKSKPSEYLDHLIGHESDGSILAGLRRRGWAQELTVSSWTGGEGFGFCRASLELLEEGLANYRQIASCILSYINLLHTTGPQHRIYTECKAILDLHFKYQEKSPPIDFVSAVAGNMHHYAAEDVLSGPCVVEEFDEDAVRGVEGWLRGEGCRIMLASSTFETAGWEREEWYGTEHLVEEFDGELRGLLRNPTEDFGLHLPEPNIFIPENLDVVKIDKQPLPPTIIKDTPIVRLWHKKDDTFFVPRADVKFLIRSPLAYSSPKNAVMCQLYVDLLNDALTDVAYHADRAGLEYNVDQELTGVEVNIWGFNDKISVLLDVVVGKMMSLIIDEGKLGVMKERRERGYKSFASENPDAHASHYYNWCLQEVLWTVDEKLGVLDDITSDDIRAFYPRLFESAHIEGFVHGNFDEKTALSLSSIVERHIHPNPLSADARRSLCRTRAIPAGSSYTHSRPLPIASNPNSAVYFTLQVADSEDLRASTCCMLLEQIAAEPCFDVLRTKEQLGYSTHCFSRRDVGVMSFCVAVQSEQDPIYVESRVEAFLEHLETILTTMDSSTYTKHTTSLRLRLLQTDKSLYETTSRLWTPIELGTLHFTFSEDTAKIVEEISLEELVEFYARTVKAGAEGRRKLSVHIWGGGKSVGGEGVLGEEEVRRVREGWELKGRYWEERSGEFVGRG
ncbi:hypothetical protein HDV00_007305 [Rhizophlyctis rosea]|nr:hypothetical protein HDV00_007305 [Rhizophlyctis rosea]